ncbi:SDR family NAD(P)-dependent oxidoreductase [Kribbella sp. NPDC050124]|uniref:SDR family NAD(P)-dependent oxidoreductase n=1 Tax=Kribbella sp. NPDC050124 TaxID=3364114 RepID=UPI0037B4854D
MMISASVRRLSCDYVVAVVGGGTGIGAATAEHIGRLGSSVFVIDEDATAAAATAAAVASTGARAGSAGADVCDVDAVQRAVDKAARWNGRIHAIVNVSGLQDRAGFDPAFDDFERTPRIALTAALVIAQAVVPRMYKAGYGRIAHLVSAGDLGLIGLVRSQSKELATTGISVNALVPPRGAIVEVAAMLAYLISPECIWPIGAIDNCPGKPT